MKKAVLLALLALASCTAGETPRPVGTPSGLPDIDANTIEAHADQFEDELPDRKAGSQEEFAAATYITAHLQQAGYVVEFDSVPVANTVRSTNIVALPPSTEDPEYLVAVAYDGRGATGVAAFLEVARALRVRVPEHSVQFVALGAQYTELNEGALGARRMVALLRDRELEPYVVEIHDEGSGLLKSYGGPLEGRLDDIEGRTDELPTTPASEVFDKAEFDYTLVTGPAADVAETLLEFLVDEAG